MVLRRPKRSESEPSTNWPSMIPAKEVARIGPKLAGVRCQDAAMLGTTNASTCVSNPSSMATMPQRMNLFPRSEEHTSALPSLMRLTYAVFYLKNKSNYFHYRMPYSPTTQHTPTPTHTQQYLTT